MRCNLCDSNDFFEVRKGIVKCKTCGLIFTFPRPSKKDISKLYNEGYFSPTEYYKRLEKADRKNFSFIFSKVKKRLPGKRVLDVGCGTGNFLLFAQKIGCEIYGIEINKESVRECRRKLGGAFIKTGEFDNCDFRNSYFDWINLGDVIEHVTDPKKLIKTVYMKLKHGGILTLSTPNADKWLARKFQFKPKEHLFYFNEKTMKRILDDSGFEVLAIKSYTLYRNLSSFAYSSTFNKSALKNIFNFISLFGDIVIRFPMNDEMFVIAEKR